VARLVAYPWPGNGREFENVIERAVILSAGPELRVAPETLATVGPAVVVPAGPPPAPAGAGLAAPLVAVEREHILAVLERTGWRIEGPHGAARLLALHPNTLRSRMQRRGIRPADGLNSERLALLRRAVAAREVEGRVDERDVRERLREVAHLPPALRVVLLGEQADVVANGEQALEEPLGVVATAKEREVVAVPPGSACSPCRPQPAGWSLPGIAS